MALPDTPVPPIENDLPDTPVVVPDAAVAVPSMPVPLVALLVARSPSPVLLDNSRGGLGLNAPVMVKGLLLPVQVCPRWSWLLSLTQGPF